MSERRPGGPPAEVGDPAPERGHQCGPEHEKRHRVMRSQHRVVNSTGEPRYPRVSDATGGERADGDLMPLLRRLGATVVLATAAFLVTSAPALATPSVTLLAPSNGQTI